MRQKPPAESPFDVIAAALIAGELLFTLFSTAVLLLNLRSVGSPFRRQLNSLWPARLLLLFLAGILSLAELLRLPLLRRRLPSPLSGHLCAAHSFLSPSLAQPAFFSTLLFLLRSSILQNPQNLTLISPNSQILTIVSTALTAALPFTLLHAIFISIPNSLLTQIGLPPYFLGHAAATAEAFSDNRAGRHRLKPCCVSLFSTILLAVLAAIYIPLFIAGVWSAVAVVINNRLRTRLYALSTAVIAALSVQVATRALASLWVPASVVSQVLVLTSFVALLVSLIAGEAILVLIPAIDFLVVVHENDKHRCSDSGIAEDGCCVAV